MFQLLQGGLGQEQLAKLFCTRGHDLKLVKRTTLRIALGERLHWIAHWRCSRCGFKNLVHEGQSGDGK